MQAFAFEMAALQRREFTMRSSLRFAVALASLAFAVPGIAAVTVQSAWLRATPPGVDVGAGYGTLRNDGAQPRQIVSVEAPVADSAMLHAMSHEHGMMQMRDAGALTVPAHGSVSMAPGHGYHLMLMGLKQPLVEGQSVPVTFVLDDGSKLKVDFAVRSAAP